MIRHSGSVFRAASFALVFFIVAATVLAAGEPGGSSETPGRNREEGSTTGLALEECLKTALENNHRRPASRFAVAMAEAQHRQALAGYWPQVNARGGYQRLDEAPEFIFPARNIEVAPGLQVPIPEQDIKLMDPESTVASAEARWLLYDGGMRRGLREQSGGALEMAKQEMRRTDLEVVDSVKRFYYGAVLARQLHRVGRETLARMEATLSLTETMYKEGAGKVNKTDYLDNKVVVESLRSAVALLEKNEIMAEAALANTMGMSWNESVRPAASDIPFTPYEGDLENLVGSAYRFSPEWARLEAGLQAAEGAVRTAQSGHYPKVALSGEVHRWWNDYKAGIATDRNKEGWSVGVGIEIPVFSGFLTQNKVREARARLQKTQEEAILLKEGIGLQIKDIFIGLNAAKKSYQATLDALNAARENRDLNTRAYENELVETEKVIRAQLVEALMAAQHYKTLYDHIALQSQLELVVGTEVLKQIESS